MVFLKKYFFLSTFLSLSQSMGNDSLTVPKEKEFDEHIGMYRYKIPQKSKEITQLQKNKFHNNIQLLVSFGVLAMDYFNNDREARKLNQIPETDSNLSYSSWSESSIHNASKELNQSERIDLVLEIGMASALTSWIMFPQFQWYSHLLWIALPSTIVGTKFIDKKFYKRIWDKYKFKIPLAATFFKRIHLESSLHNSQNLFEQNTKQFLENTQKTNLSLFRKYYPLLGQADKTNRVKLEELEEKNNNLFYDIKNNKSGIHDQLKMVASKLNYQIEPNDINAIRDFAEKLIKIDLYQKMTQTPQFRNTISPANFFNSQEYQLWQEQKKSDVLTDFYSKNPNISATYPIPINKINPFEINPGEPEKNPAFMKLLETIVPDTTGKEKVQNIYFHQHNTNLIPNMSPIPNKD